MIFFETIKCNDEKIFHLNYHQNRIARTIGLNIDLSNYIYPPSSALLKCKVIYDKNGIIDIVYSLYSPKEIKKFKLIFNDDILYNYKSTNRKLLNDLYDQKNNADEIIIIKNGFVTDTSIANIAIFYDNYWATPRLPLLEGTTRHRLLDKKFLIKKDITIKQLEKTKTIALMNAMIDFKIIDNFDLVY